MFAIIAAVLFGLALLFDLAKVNLGTTVTAATLVTAGFLCVALHLAPLGTGRRWSWRRR